MINHTALALAAGPSYTRAIMGQGPSAAEREHARKASSTILRENSIRIEESENVSMTDSWSMHFDCTTQAPYSPASKADSIPREDLPHVTKDSALYELALFLRNTGPLPPHRRPSKIEPPSRAVARRRKAMQFLKPRRSSSREGDVVEHDQTCAELRDEGGLLADLPEQPIPKGYEQKVSSTGQKYLALQEPEQDLEWNAASVLGSPSVVDSRVSICFTDGINPVIHSDSLEPERDVQDTRERVHPAWRSYDFAFSETEAALGAMDHSSTPIRPPASDPPTPEPLSAVSLTESFQTGLTEHPPKRSIDNIRSITNRQLYAATSSSLPLAQAFDRITDVTIQYPVSERDVDIKHPSPRRFASHTALLQRSSTIASCRRSISNSPGPPPRSPLRLKRDTKNIEGITKSYNYDRTTPKVAPIIPDAKSLRAGVQPIQPTVVTDCTGPIKRPNSRGESIYSTTRKEREEKTRARKIRDRPIINISNPIPTRTIDAIVHAPLPTPRHRLKKARPHIQIPDLKPAPLATRASSLASSNASWRKITETTRTPVSAVPSEDTPTTCGEKTGYTPISPTASNGSVTAEARMALSPVMLVAEEVPIPKAKLPPKPARLVTREVKSYAPRPRSASIPRNAMKRRSRHGGQTPSRPGSPSQNHCMDDAPPLPSPPPNRALPPTPPASGSEKQKRTNLMNAASREKELPLLPANKIISNLKESIPHVASQMQRQPTASEDKTNANDIHKRLEALEKQNALLSAALTAVLQTNGAVNGPIYNFANSERQIAPMAWQNRMARRSAATHDPSKSNDSAMKLYHNTRREI